MRLGAYNIAISLIVIIGMSIFSAGAQSLPEVEGGEKASSDSIAAPAVNDSIPADSLQARSSGAAGVRQRPDRKITPVDIDDDKPRTVLHYYDKHGDPLDEPVLFLATLDTVTKAKSSPVYALYNGVDIGVNFADAIMMAAGQKYGSFDVWADVSLHNWFFPVIEAGVGFANNKPENSNYRYKGKPSFYTKVGINYNFLYKSNDAYRFFLGLRVGYSNFSYDVSDVHITSDYWGETQNLTLKGLHSHAFYGEVLAGLQVKIVDRFSMGWNIRYHYMIKTINNSLSNPWFIPGYGANSPITFTLSAIYTLPGGGKKSEPSVVTSVN